MYFDPVVVASPSGHILLNTLLNQRNSILFLREMPPILCFDYYNLASDIVILPVFITALWKAANEVF